MRQILSLFTKDKRDRILGWNIILSAFLKVIGMLCSLLIVPVTINYLNKETYGIWLTMSSILYWFSFFDIGLGNGMRNYLTEAIATKQYERARNILGLSFTVLFVIALIMGGLFFILVSLVDLNKLFNTNTVSSAVLKESMCVAIVFTMMLFVMKNLGNVFIALQKYAMHMFLVVLGNVLSLSAIFVLTQTTGGSLYKVVWAFTLPPVLVFLIAAIPIFIKYPYLKPNFNYFDKQLAYKIMNKGLGFFLIQITSCLVIYGSSNLFISQAGGPSEVTVYNIAYKYFNLLAIGYTIIISPMWNAYTEAYAKGDINWVSKTFKRSLVFWFVSVLIGIIMLLFCGYFYNIWIGGRIQIPLSVSLCVFLYVSMFNLNNCVTYLLNGLNKIKVQTYVSILTTALFISSIIVFGKKNGIVGVVACMAFSYLLMSIIHYCQCRMLLRGTAKGIWNK